MSDLVLINWLNLNLQLLLIFSLISDVKMLLACCKEFSVNRPSAVLMKNR